MQKNKKVRRRNNELLDTWSLVHLATGMLLGWLINPIYALIIMTAWEPLEIFVLSPILARFGINFGYETLKNSLSDIAVNIVGIAIGAFVIKSVFGAPF